MGGLLDLKYAPGTEADFFTEWCEKNLYHSVDRWAGKPVIWESWQRDFFEELLACDDDCIPYWSNGALLVPRKNGKTLMLGALAVYRLLIDEDQPEILLAAATDKQAGRLFDQCISFLRKNKRLDEQIHRREYAGEIVNPETGGKIIRLPSSGETLDGYNPSLAIIDELHAWDTPIRRRVWTSLNTGDGARERAQIVTITTAGDAHKRQTGILGRMLDSNEANGECERSPGITISRNHTARTIVFNYSAPTSDPRDVVAMKQANPASWVTEEFLARKAANSELTDSEVLQLHGNVWAEGVLAWIDAASWEACRVSIDEAEIPRDSNVCLGVDIGLTHDSSAVAVAWARADGKIVLNCTVWSAVPNVLAHVTVPGGTMDLGIIEQHIMYLHELYQIDEMAYDPRFFERSAQLLADHMVVVPMQQTAAPMADAYQTFYQGVHEKRVLHNGDGVLTAHVMATAAQKGERGWKISKIRSSQRIDAVPASAVAMYRAEANLVLGDGGVIYG